MNPRGFGIAAALVVLACAGHARASGNEAAAEALFLEAKKLVAKGRYAEACPKLAESNRLDRAAGTLLHLGNCYEKNGQTASAWATYKDAASAAQALGRKDWEKLASQRARSLEEKLAHLTIKLDAGNAAGVEVARDGTPVSQASLNVPIPVDTGPHTVVATSPGHRRFETTVTVVRDGQAIDVAVPLLEHEPAPAPSPVASPAPTPSLTPSSAAAANEPAGGGRRTVGFVVGGVGVAGLAVGAVTGLMAMGATDDARAICPDDGRCASREAVDASERARTLGLVSTIAFVAGGVGLATGVALVLTAPSPPDRGAGGASTASDGRVRITPHAGLDGSAGLDVVGVF